MTTKELIALAKQHYPNSAISVSAETWDHGASLISLWVAELKLHFNGNTLAEARESFGRFQGGLKAEAETVIEEISNGNQPL